MSMEKKSSGKFPKLKLKSNLQKTEESSPLKPKESNPIFIQLVEEPNNKNIKVIQSINSSGNETTSRTIKPNAIPVLKQREKKAEILNPNIKIITKSDHKKNKRFDRNGVEINHRNKKNVKITFKDEIEGENFCEFVDIENLKEYMKGNYGKVDRKDHYVKNNTCVNCSCNIL